MFTYNCNFKIVLYNIKMLIWNRKKINGGWAVKKNLLLSLVCMFSFVFIFGACSSGGGGGNGKVWEPKRIDFEPTWFIGQSAVLDIQRDIWYFVSGDTLSLDAFFWIQDPDDKYTYTSDDKDPELANTLWNIGGNIGHFAPQGTTEASGANVSIAITAAGGATGTISVECDGLKYSHTIKIVASKEDLPVTD